MCGQKTLANATTIFIVIIWQKLMPHYADPIAFSVPPIQRHIQNELNEYFTHFIYIFRHSQMQQPQVNDRMNAMMPFGKQHNTGTVSISNVWKNGLIKVEGKKPKKAHEWMKRCFGRVWNTWMEHRRHPVTQPTRMQRSTMRNANFALIDFESNVDACEHRKVCNF